MIFKVVPIIFVAAAFCYNVDIDFPIIYSATKSDTYFGYTVLLYTNASNNTSCLIVGAPRGNYTRSLTEKALYKNEPGIVYRCVIEASCQEIRPKRIMDEDGYIPQLGMKILIKKQQGWFGAAMSIHKFADVLTVCAPRTIISIFNQFTEVHIDTMQGMCYTGRVLQDTLSIEEGHISDYDFSTQYWYNPLYGFSIHYASSQRNGNEMVSRIVGQPKHDVSGTVDINNIKSQVGKVTVDLPTSDELSQFGYSVTSGHFFRKDQLLFASGAPGWQYVGQVGIINPTLKSPIIAVLHGTETGEFFGASLATGDLNNDGLDDLIVGAPYWGRDNGKVYVYLGTTMGQFEVRVFLEGTVQEGHFGYAIACGDLDGDNFDDIIVGAPWEERGVIYIYNGGEIFESDMIRASQRISVLESLQLNSYKIERFGFSISEPVDIDRNGYSDIAVGAYKSGHAIVLRSKPVVNTRITIETVPDILQRDAAGFMIKICSKYDGYKFKNLQNIKITLVVDERYQRTKETLVELKPTDNAELCVHTNITIMENVQDFIEPISILARHDFINDGTSSRFCKTCPVENINNKLKVAQLLLPFDIDCGDDKLCNSNISATARFYGVRNANTWVIGSNDISLEINLHNSGEPAYLVTLTFLLPDKVILRSILASCQEDLSDKNLIVNCDVGNPVAEGEKKSIKLDLDMRHLTHGSLHGHQLDFFMEIKTRSINHGTINVTTTLNLITEVSLSLNGKATEESYYLSATDKNPSHLSFQHAYQIYKLGATPIEEAQLVIKVPTATQNSVPLIRVYKPRLYVSGELYECSSLNTILIETQAFGVQDPSLLNHFELHMTQKMQTNTSRRQRETYNQDGNESIFEDRYTSGMVQRTQLFYDTKTVTESQAESADRYSMEGDIVYFNCSTPTVNCSTIVCDLSALRTLQDVGKVLVRFLLDVSMLKDNIAKGRTVLKFSTEARVQIFKPGTRLSVNGTRSTTKVTTLFYSSPNQQKVQFWIVLVSISVGLLLLFIFAIILSMVGFFKRGHKHELTAKKDNETTESETKESENKLYEQ